MIAHAAIARITMEAEKISTMFCLNAIGIEVRKRERKMKVPVGIPDLRYWPLRLVLIGCLACPPIIVGRMQALEFRLSRMGVLPLE